MVTIIRHYVKNREGKSRVQREGRGEEEKGRRDKKRGEENEARLWLSACGFRQPFPSPPSYKWQFICYKPMAGAQELKYPGGTRPLWEEGGTGRGRRGRRAWRRLSILTGCPGRPGPVQSLAAPPPAPGKWLALALRRGGLGSSWQVGPCSSVHFRKQQCGYSYKKESSEQHEISWNGIFVFTNDCSTASPWQGARKHV